MSSRKWSRTLWLTLGGLALVLLAAAVFTLGSLNAPVRPATDNQFVILFALSTFFGATFLVFGLVLIRTLVRTWTERRAGILGSRFKTKMLVGAMGVSLLPVVFLFFFSYALVNRTLNVWFPRPLEEAANQSSQLLQQIGGEEHQRLEHLAISAARRRLRPDQLQGALGGAVDAAWMVSADGHSISGVSFEYSVAPANTPGAAPSPALNHPISPQLVRRLPSHAELWKAGDALYLAGGASFDGATLLLGRRMPSSFLSTLNTIEANTHIYEQQRQNIRAYKRQILAALLLITVLLLFATTWVALYLSKLVTVPIQALAQATGEVARGNLDHRVEVEAHDELDILVASFNQMTAQLAESRRQIDDSTRSLQLAIEEREGRRKLMEAVLENIPTGVISLDPGGEIARVNSAVHAIFGEHARHSRTIAELAGEDAAREILHLMRRSLRMGVASRELGIPAGGRLLNAAVTVSSLGPRRANPGFVVVIDDLTELLRAQKAAAWQEVARRIAHEIKNPLTPIQLSAQRLLRYLERTRNAETPQNPAALESLVAECAGLIEQEVSTLASLVDEFSQFVRFPAARLAPVDLNAIVAGALEVFHGRLDGIRISTDLAPALPPVRADAELLRRVLVNLIDNAAEAMEGAPIRRLDLATRLDHHGEALEITIADSGPGISPEDKDLLFLPQFSTKERGTGLGLAIASRIIAEHNGTLRVEDNVPTGARFLIRIPAAEVPLAVAIERLEA